MGKFTDTETGVKLAVPVAQKLALAVIMLGALSALAAVAVGLTYQLPKEKTQNVIGPFKPLQLSDGAPSTVYIQDSGVAEFQFYRDGVLMATYNKSVFDENEDINMEDVTQSGATIYSIVDFQPADNIIDPASKSPLRVKLSQSVKDTAVIPAMTFSLVTNIGVKTLCLPANTLNINGVANYYYDVEGTPYFNSALTQKAMIGKCVVNSQAYVPADISTLRIIPEYPQEVPDGFGMYFVRYDQNMMIYTSKTFQAPPGLELNFIPGGKSPLAISTGYTDVEKTEITVPARILLMETNLGFLNVCLPGQTITGTWSDTNHWYLGKGATYYIDKNGTPYLDELLTQLAISTACLSKAYLPKDITSIEMTPYEGQTPESYIAMWIFRSSHSEQSLMMFAQNTFVKPEGGEPINFASYDKDPLIIHPGYVSTTQAEMTIPARTMVVHSDLGTHTLCLPGQTVQGIWHEQEGKYFAGGTPFYYDKNGNPYTDILLLDAVNCDAPSVTACQDGTLASACNSTSQYCDPGTLNLINHCAYCGYTCPSNTPYCDVLSGVCLSAPNNNSNTNTPLKNTNTHFLVE